MYQCHALLAEIRRVLQQPMASELLDQQRFLIDTQR